MYKIMIIEDDTGIATGIAHALEGWDMETKIAENWHDLIKEFTEYTPHLVLMDIGLPVKNGYMWCQEIRRISKVPIIFISSASDKMNIVMAMNMGADDFIVKPFDADVLIAKVQALLRRTYHFATEVSVIAYKDVILDTETGGFVYNDNHVTLSKNEYRILFTLMKSKGQIVSREKLMDELWQTDEFVDDNALTVNVGRLRRKLEAVGLKDFIKTKFGVGYYLSDETVS